jgi:hypothetical protein
MKSTVVTINKVDLPVKEFNGKRVVTLKDVDNVHERTEGTARRNFNANKKHFILGEDYIQRNSLEAKIEYGLKAPNGLTLLTESGYLMIVKSFQDDLAWDVQRQLVNSYFKLKEVSYSVSEGLPVNLQSINQTIQELSNNFNILCSQVNSIENAFDEQFQEFKNVINKLGQLSLLQSNQNKPKQITVKQISSDPIRDTIKPLAELLNDKSVGYNNTYRKVYAAMSVDWKRRQSRYRNINGNQNRPSKMHLLEADTKLLSLFTDTVNRLLKEYAEVK